MANQTTDRDAPQLLQQPSYADYGNTDPTASETVRFGQLIQAGADGYFRPYNPSFSSGSVLAGVSQQTSTTYSPTAPFLYNPLQVKKGAFGFANDVTNPIVSGTLENTIVWATDDQTFGLVGGSNRLPARLVKFVPNDPYPVYAEVGRIPSGTIA